MADNLSQIVEAIGNINATLNVNATQVFDTAITTSNEGTGGWLGIIIFTIMSFSVLTVLLVKKQAFGVSERTTLFMMFLAIILDIGIYLFKFNILQSLYLIIWLFTFYYVIIIFSLLKKELESSEN